MQVDDETRRAVAFGGALVMTGVLLVAVAVAVSLTEAPGDGVLFLMPYFVGTVGAFFLFGGGVAVVGRLRRR
ncbi:hypothetical protein ACFO0N_18260 [Halobium salinum]|uniref:Integral membrane protein n=1 Tax=Halobium salinum TaxID=1364940 RepID=A0ABD5PGQ4_9EURY|nr:hypothetical protein [Halobium salinum]